MSATVNLNRVRKVFGESKKSDNDYTKEISDTSLLRQRRISEDSAKSSLYSDESFYNDDATIDPYDSTPKSKRISKKDIVTLSDSKYKTSLLEQLVKNQNNIELNNSIREYQDKSLTYLENINNILESKFKPQAGQVNDPMTAANKELTREVSDLAKAVASLNPGKTGSELVKGLLKTTGLSEVFDPLNMFKDLIVTSIKDGELGAIIKEQVKSFVIDKLPSKHKDYINRFQEDPVILIQDIINKLGLSKNDAISEFFKVHMKGSKIREEKETFNPSALANFDNKFYYSVTKIMPDQLFKANAFLEKIATGKTPQIQRYNWEINDYESLADAFKRYMDNHISNTDATNSVYGDLMYRLESILSSSGDKSGILNRTIKRDQYGNIIRDNNGDIDFSDKESMKALLSEIVQNKDLSLETLRGDIDIDKFLKHYKLSTKKVNGKTVNRSDDEIYQLKNSAMLLNRILNMMDPEDATRLENDMMYYKTRLVSQNPFETGGWSSDVLKQFSDVLHGNADPETLKNIFGSNGIFNRSSDNTTSQNNQSSESSGSKKYKNSRNEDVTWEELSDNERKEYAQKAASKIKYGDLAAEEVINKKRSQFIRNESKEQTEIRHAFEVGVITASEYSDFKNGLLSYESLKPKVETLHEVTRIYNNLDRLNITADKMHATNPNISIESYRRMGYLNSPEDIINNMKNGRLDYEKLSELNNIYSSDSLRKSIEKGPAYKGNIIDIDDPTGSIEKVFSSIFSDPIIGKKAGIMTGGAVGLGIGKLLNQTGFVRSPKAGLILGSIGAALMMTERARIAADNIFGPEGNIKNENGFSNREIFLSKLMTRWLPSLGVGGSVMKGTMSLFSKMGPWGKLIGLPAALTLGLTAGIMTPKIISVGQKKIFSKEARESGSKLGKLGEWIHELDIPFIEKYFMPSEDLSDFEVLLKSTRNEVNKAQKNVDDLKESLKLATRQADKNNLNEKIKEAESYLRLYDTAYKELKNISSNNDISLDEKMQAAENIINNLESKLTEEQIKHRRNAYNVMRENTRFDGSSAADAKMGNFRDRAKTGKRIYENNGDFSNTDVNYRLNILSESKNKSSGFKDILDDYENIYTNIINRKNQIKSTGYGDANLTKILTEISSVDSYNEKVKKLEDYFKEIGGDELSPELSNLKEFLLDQAKLQHKNEAFYKSVKDVYRYMYSNLSEEDLDSLVNKDVESMLSERKIKSGRRTYKESIKSTMKNFFTQDLKDDDSVIIDEIIKSFAGGKGTEGDSKLIKMKDLSNVKFKNGSKLSEAGCSVVAFNNALFYLKYPPIEVNSLVSVANNYLTSEGGVTSDFFLAMGSKLDLSVKIFNKEDNTFTLKNIIQLSPNNNRSLIALMENTNNNGSHFITIKSIQGDKCVVNDPEVNGTIDMSLSTIISRALEFITIEINPSNIKLQASKETKTKSQKIASKIANSLPGRMVKKGISIYNKMKALPKMYDNIKEILESPNSGDIIKDRIISKTKDIISTFKKDLKSEILGKKISEEELIQKEQSELNVKPDDINQKSTDKTYTPQVITSNSINDILIKLFNQVNRFFSEPLPVSILSDQTLALQASDEASSLALADANTSSNSALEIANAKKIKSVRRKRELRKEREESQKVQEAIINQEQLLAGTSTGIGGKGTGNKNNIPGAGNSEGEPDRVEPENKITIIPPFISKIAKFGLTKALPFIGASAASVAPVYLAHRAGDHLRYNIFEQTTSLFKDSTENIVDKDGNVIEGGSYADVSGLYRNMRTMKGLYKYGLKAGSLIGQGLSKLGGAASSFLTTKAADLTSKIADSSGVRKIANKITQKSMELASKSFKTLGDSGALWSKILGMLEGFMSKVLNASTMLSKIPFVGKYASQIGETILKMTGKLVKMLNGSLGKKFGQSIVAKVMNPANMSKKVPLIGIAIMAAMGIASIVNGFRVPDKILLINKEDVTLKHRFQAAGLKFLWDVVPSAISSIIGTLTGGVGGIATDVIVVLLQTIIGFDRFANLCGFDEEWRKAQRKKGEQSDEEESKQINKSIESDNKHINELEKEKNNDIKNQENELNKPLNVEGIIKDENQNAGVSNQDLNAEDITGEANKIDNENANDKSFKPIVIPRQSIFDSSNTNTQSNNSIPKPKDKKPSKDADQGIPSNNKKQIEKTVENSTKLKLSDSAQEALKMWQNADKNYFHPVGNDATKITSAFGPRRIKNGSNPHKGIDFSTGGMSGKPIYAYKPGKVVSSSQSLGLVSIQHSDGTTSRYLHMSERFVKKGQNVSAGDKIGLSGGIGSSGHESFDPHLHFEIKDQTGRNLDPFLALGLNPSVINLTPASRNRENIDYFERYPWLKDKDSVAKSTLNNVAKADAKTDITNEPLPRKDAGGPPDSGIKERSYSESKDLTEYIDNGLSKIASALGLKSDNKDDMIITLLNKLAMSQDQQNKMMSTMIQILTNLSSIMENKSNNDMYEALKMSR